MKSAIFQDNSRAEPRAIRKIAKQIRPRSLSPYVPSHVSTPNLPFSTWNLDEMVSSYTSSGALPMLLSPTLPPQFESSAIPKTMSNFEIGDDLDSDKLESDIDNMPMSLLSPTLPKMFAKAAKPRTQLVLPSPKKLPSTVDSVLRTVKCKVRWIDKREAEKPRFLLRISFGQLTSYKNAFRSKSPIKGLGISERKPEKEKIKQEVKKEDTKSETVKLEKPHGSKDDSPHSHWMKMARETQAFADKVRAKDPLLGVVAQFDWLLTMAVSCDHDEKLKSANVDRHWSTLHDVIPPVVANIESYIKTHNVQDKKKAYLSFLVGILAVVKALILKRVNLTMPSSQDADKKMEGLQKQLANYTSMADHFEESQSFFSNCPAPATIFPKSWHNRSPSVTKPTMNIMAPGADAYYLPLGPYSDLHEGCAYLCCCLREFAELYGAEMNNGVRYNLQCAKKAR